MTFEEQTDDLIATLSSDERVCGTEDLIKEAVLRGAKLGIEASIETVKTS